MVSAISRPSPGEVVWDVPEATYSAAIGVSTKTGISRVVFFW